MKIKGISASSYDTYSWCQWRFWLTQVLGFYDESGSAAIMGNIGHKVCEVLAKASMIGHDRNSRIFDPHYLWDISFNHYYNELPEQAESIKTDKLVKICKGIHELLDSEYTPVRDNIIGVEQMFNIAITDPRFIIAKDEQGPKYLNVRGRIDRVDKINDNTIEVIDYKTGTRTDYSSPERQKKDSVSLHKEIQPRMYHLASKFLYPWADNILVTFIYLVDGGPVTIPFCDKDVDGTKEMLNARYQAIKNDNDPQRNITWKCKNLCSFYKDGTCDSVWHEKDKHGHDFIHNKYTVLNYRKKRS